jgi:hypothetical protein
VSLQVPAAAAAAAAAVVVVDFQQMISCYVDTYLHVIIQLKKG